MKYSEQLQQLLTLGKLQDVPLDYSSLGLDVEHADELIRMATDPKLLDNDENSLEFWATIHAWYAIAQLRITEAVAPLLDLHEQYPFDMFIDQEFPKVFAVMGESAIPELKSYLFDGGRDDITRSYALSCIEAIALTHRQECLGVISEVLTQADQSSKSLSGLAICSLIKLNAIETIDTIKDVFKRDCVDISIPGDLEDVEIALGLRFKRDTPKPDYNKFSPEMTQALNGLSELVESKAKSVEKVGRNDPCPCGSGKKYKKCCLH